MSSEPNLHFHPYVHHAPISNMNFSLDDLLYTGRDDAEHVVPFETVEANPVHIPNAENAQAEPTNLQETSYPTFDIDWQTFDANFSGTNTSPISGTGEVQDLGFTLLGEPQTWDIPAQPDFQGFNTGQTTDLDNFFIQHGAYRPEFPCTHCARLRLQCLIIQTTSANPNPITSCSSCVALFRECSLAGNQKRNPLNYETAQPVIGQLHGVREDGDPAINDEIQLQGTPISGPGLSSKRSHTRSVKRTRVLKNWFACHLDHPYPSEDEKSALAKESGLSKTQVVNWFANNRRRHRMSSQARANSNNKLFPQGSPMPRSFLSNMSPIERWKNSPPDEEPASTSAIERAVRSRSSSHGSLDSAGVSAGEGGALSASGDSFLYSNSLLDASSNSGSSCYSYRSNDNFNLVSPSGQSSAGEGPSAWLNRPRSKGGKTNTFQCTFCSQSFKKKYDWIRHERSIHLPGLDCWICSVPVLPDQSHVVWRVSQTDPECIFCGDTSPTDEHIQAHEFQTCAERPMSERTFTRKDHLWQHLQKFHGCRKWDGWSPNLSLLQHRKDLVRSTCGFCGIVMDTWEERTQHLAGHFKAGMSMDDWVGGPGVDDPGISGA